jgi:hypothetical protein
MEFDVMPEPSAQELRALEAALGDLDGHPRPAAAPYESVWRLAGLLENVDSAPSAPAAGVGSRSIDGAKRA